MAQAQQAMQQKYPTELLNKFPYLNLRHSGSFMHLGPSNQVYTNVLSSLTKSTQAYKYIFPECIQSIVELQCEFNEDSQTGECNDAHNISTKGDLYNLSNDELKYYYSSKNYSRLYRLCHNTVTNKHKESLKWSALSYGVDYVFDKSVLEEPTVPFRKKKVNVVLREKTEFDIPKGYKIVRMYDDCTTGFKAIKAVSEDGRYCRFAVAGTESVPDAIADLGLGQIQIKGKVRDEFFMDLVDCIDHKNNKGFHDKSTLITGHSLGGLLAQYYGQLAAMTVISRYPVQKSVDLINLDIVTWNAPGGTQLLLRELWQNVSGRIKTSKNVTLSYSDDYVLDVQKLKKQFGSKIKRPKTFSEVKEQYSMFKYTLLDRVFATVKYLSTHLKFVTDFKNEVDQLMNLYSINQTHYRVASGTAYMGDWVSNLGIHTGLILSIHDPKYPIWGNYTPISAHYTSTLKKLFLNNHAAFTYVKKVNFSDMGKTRQSLEFILAAVTEIGAKIGPGSKKEELLEEQSDFNSESTTNLSGDRIYAGLQCHRAPDVIDSEVYPGSPKYKRTVYKTAIDKGTLYNLTLGWFD